MELRCPECLSPLFVAGSNAKCLAHGGEYQVLFAQPETAPAPTDPSAVTAASLTATRAAMCAKHPTVPALYSCTVCGKPVCKTCEFSFPGNVHLCPDCATNPNQTLSPKRKRNLIWSYVMAAGATVALVFLTVVAAALAGSKETENIVGVLFSLFVLIPAIIGTALSVGALDRRLRNPVAIWIAAIWNGLLLGVFLLLTILGIMSG